MPIPNLKPHPYSEIFPLMMMDMFSAAISRGSRSYLTARMADLTLGTPQRGRWAVQPYRLTREELKTCPNYRFYCRLWRALSEQFSAVKFTRSASHYYRGDWPKRWQAEKSGYSSLILVAFLSTPFSSGQTIIEYHDTPMMSDGKYRYIGAGCAREIADMVHPKRRGKCPKPVQGASGRDSSR